MSKLIKLDVKCERGDGVHVSFEAEYAIARPAIWLDMMHDGRSELVLVSQKIDAVHQLSPGARVPAVLYAREDVPRFEVSSMQRGSRMELHFKTTRVYAESFTVWFGDREDVQRKADEIGVKAPF